MRIYNVCAGNHKNIFSDAGVEWKEYRYFDPATVGLDYHGLIADLQVHTPTHVPDIVS